MVTVGSRWIRELGERMLGVGVLDRVHPSRVRHSSKRSTCAFYLQTWKSDGDPVKGT